MLRRTPLKRKTRLRSRSKTSAHARRPRDFAYMRFVATQACIARLLVSGGINCAGRIEVNHVGGRYGKDADRNTVPMCTKHHEDWTGRVGGGGLFAGWSIERRREWGRQAIAATLLAWTTAYTAEVPF